MLKWDRIEECMQCKHHFYIRAHSNNLSVFAKLRWTKGIATHNPSPPHTHTDLISLRQVWRENPSRGRRWLWLRRPLEISQSCLTPLWPTGRELEGNTPTVSVNYLEEGQSEKHRGTRSDCWDRFMDTFPIAVQILCTSFYYLFFLFVAPKNRINV